MKTHRTTFLKALTIALTIAGVMIMTQGQARADEVTISGFTTGSITGLPPGTLTFTGNANFTNTTFFNIGALSGSNSLGTFFLSTAEPQLLSGSFQLNVTFTSPTGISGGQGPTAYTAVINGSVSPNLNEGGVNINFDNTPVVFTFNNGVSSGSFSLAVADLYVETGHSASITAGTTGQQQTAEVPEPATLLLLGTGLTGIAAKLRKRRNDRKKLEE